jgi:signal transduction histidine kinase
VGVKYWKAQNEANLGQMVRAAELGFLAGGISHEFNNYLAKIMFLCEVINVEDQNQTKKDIKTIYDQCVQANKFITDFRSIAKREDKIKEFDMEDLIKQVINISRQRCIDYAIRITFRDENKSVTRVVFPPSHIQSIIINLINNAIEAISEDKEKKPGLIEIVTYYDGAHLTIEVNDNGKGIKPEDQQLVFAPFYTTKSTGMGIGLFWVRQLVSELGGDIRINSPYKDWSTSFIIKLPAAKGGEK